MNPPSGRGRPRRRRPGLPVLAVLLAAVLATCGTTTVAAPTPDPPPSAAPDPGPRSVCGSPVPGVLGTTDRTIRHAGVPRSYTLHLPEAYDGSRPLPVVVLLHGLGRDPRTMLAMTRMDRLADAEDVVVVAPRAGGKVPTWRFAAPGGGPGPDVDFVEAVLDDLEATTCTDPARTYAVGFSNGGALTMALACRAEQRFAAFASVAGPWRSSDCGDAPPTSVLLVHGTGDGVVDFDGSRTRIGRLPGAFSAAAAWARHDGCGAATRTRHVPGVSRLTWDGCVAGTEVELLTVHGGGHRWPGGDRPGATRSTPLRAPSTARMDATRDVWAFLAPHRLGG